MKLDQLQKKKNHHLFLYSDDHGGSSEDEEVQLKIILQELKAYERKGKALIHILVENSMNMYKQCVQRPKLARRVITHLQEAVEKQKFQTITIENIDIRMRAGLAYHILMMEDPERIPIPQKRSQALDLYSITFQDVLDECEEQLSLCEGQPLLVEELSTKVNVLKGKLKELSISQVASIVEIAQTMKENKIVDTSKELSRLIFELFAPFVDLHIVKRIHEKSPAKIALFAGYIHINEVKKWLKASDYQTKKQTGFIFEIPEPLSQKELTAFLAASPAQCILS